VDLDKSPTVPYLPRTTQLLRSENCTFQSNFIFTLSCSSRLKNTPILPRHIHAPKPITGMHKISNFTGQARHGWEKMTPAAFGMSRSNQDFSLSSPVKRPVASTPISPLTPADTVVNLSFNVPFASNLPGPDPEEVLHSSPGAFERWTHPEGTDEETPTHKLPVHANNVEVLRRLCRAISDESGARLEAAVTSSEPKPIPALQRRPLKGLVTNVCISGDGDTVHKMRAKVLNETPIALVWIM